MPIVQPATGFLSNEWERFLDGIRQLNPNDAQRILRELQQKWAHDKAPPTISIPGWDDVIHLTPRPSLTPAEVAEYWRARRERRDPNISAEARAELDRRAAAVRRIRSSTAPVYAQAFGQILTAIDNVQDLLSTLATFGRLALWASPRLLGRLIPGIGLIILASDILNLMSFLSMLATPIYALLCGGPRHALAAGIPALLFKQALKRETWKIANLNPWSASAIARRAGKLRYGPIGISNLLEVAQTTDQLFGIGISLGGIIGALQEAAYGAVLQSRGVDITVNRDGPYQAWIDLMRPKFDGMVFERIRTGYSASHLLAAGSSIAAVQQHFTTNEHLAYLAALQPAIELTTDDLRGVSFHDILSDAFTTPMRPTFSVDPATDLQLRAEFPHVHPIDRWHLPGYPQTITPQQYVAHLTRKIPRATYDFIAPRRTHPQGMFAGALVTQATHSLWLMFEQDSAFFRWHFTTDQRIIAGLAEQGFVIAPTTPEDRAWALWSDYRDITERKDKQTLCPCHYVKAADNRGVTLIRLLPTEADLPPQWDNPELPTSPCTTCQQA